MQRKLIKVGTSAAVIIPKSVLYEQGIKIGDTVHVKVSKKEATKPALDIDPEIFEWTKKFRQRYQPLLNKLKNS